MIAGPLIGTWRAVQAKKDSQYEKFCRYEDTSCFDRFLADMNTVLLRKFDGRTDFRQTYDPFTKARAIEDTMPTLAPPPEDVAPAPAARPKGSLADPSFTHANIFKKGDEIKRVKSYKAAVLCLKASDPETDPMLREAFSSRVERALLVRSVLETVYTNRDQFSEDYELIFILHAEECETSRLSTVPMLEAVKNTCYRCPSKISDGTKVDIHIPSKDKHYQVCATCGAFLKAWHAVCHWTRLTRIELASKKPRSVTSIASASATNIITVEGTMRQYMATIPTFLQHYTALYSGEEDPSRDMYTIDDARRFFGVDEFVPPPPKRKKKKKKSKKRPAQQDAGEMSAPPPHKKRNNEAEPPAGFKRHRNEETDELVQPITKKRKVSEEEAPPPPPRKKKGHSALPPPPPHKKRKKRKERSESEYALPPPPPRKKKKKE